jgi:hypothetical protein
MINHRYGVGCGGLELWSWVLSSSSPVSNQLREVDFVRLDDLWFHQFNLYSIGCLKLQKMPHLTLLVQDPIREISR